MQPITSEDRIYYSRIIPRPCGLFPLFIPTSSPAGLSLGSACKHMLALNNETTCLEVYTSAICRVTVCWGFGNDSAELCQAVENTFSDMTFCQDFLVSSLLALFVFVCKTAQMPLCDNSLSSHVQLLWNAVCNYSVTWCRALCRNQTRFWQRIWSRKRVGELNPGCIKHTVKVTHV